MLSQPVNISRKLGKSEQDKNCPLKLNKFFANQYYTGTGYRNMRAIFAMGIGYGNPMFEDPMEFPKLVTLVDKSIVKHATFIPKLGHLQNEVKHQTRNLCVLGWGTHANDIKQTCRSWNETLFRDIQ